MQNECRTLLSLLAVAVVMTAAPALAQGHRYAILVGVQKYSKSSGLSDLSYTEKDVEGLAEVLLNTGYRESDVTILTQKHALTENDLKFLPTRKNILEEIHGRLEILDQEDSILIAVAGHGLQFKSEKNCYFCPADAVVDDKETLVSLNDIYASLEKCKASVKLVICDACRNSALAAGTRRAIVDVESVTRPQEIKPPGGVAALYSCSLGQVAFENGELGHGVFFHYVIDGLKGKADFDHDSEVDLLELAKYTQKQVKDYVFNKYDRAIQLPQLLGETNGQISLVDLRVNRMPASVEGKGETWAVSVDSTPIQAGERTVAMAVRGDRFRILEEQNGWCRVQPRSSSVSPGWIQKQHLSDDQKDAAGSDIMILWDTQWWPAQVVKTENGRFYVHYHGYDDSWNEWVTPDRTTAVDQKLKPYLAIHKWSKNGWPCNIIKVDGDRVLIQYSGYNSAWHEWVSKDHVTALNPNLPVNASINRALMAH